MKRTRIQDDLTFTLIDEEYTSAIIPHYKRQLKRDVRLFGDVVLKGGIYGQSLEVSADDVVILGSVYVDHHISLKSDKKGGSTWFNAPVNAEQSILVTDGSGLSVRFGKSIRSKNVTLNNSIIYGNVIGEKVFLKNSIVLGNIIAKDELNLDHALIGSFMANKVSLTNGVGIMHPATKSTVLPEIEGGLFFVVPSFESDSGHITYPLSTQDFFKVTDTKESFYMLSLTARAFDFRPIKTSINQNLQRIYDLTSRSIDDVESDKSVNASFDQVYRSILDANFVRSKPAFSPFMEVTNSELGFEQSESDNVEPPDSVGEATQHANEKNIPDSRNSEQDEGMNTDHLSEADIQSSEETITSQTIKPIFCTKCGSKRKNDQLKFCIECGAKYNE